MYAGISPVQAQVVTPPVSQVPIPAKSDSASDSARVKTDGAKAKADSIKADSIKAPIGRFADPLTSEIGPQYDWNRAQLFATGALTLIDLLDRIPGITTFRSGWLSTPQTATFNGDFRRVRVFYDGLEIDDLDNTSGRVHDLSTIQIWTLEHLTIERSASELRLYMRSWRVDNTDPYTRVDVATGNEDTNLYRGFYGKRYDNGGVLQLGGQQYGVASPRFSGSGDALSLLGRVGIARKVWSVDGFVNRYHATRDIERGALGRPPVLSLDQTITNAYLRAAVGAASGGPWAQITAGSLAFKGKTGPNRDVSATSQPDTLERRVLENQYNVSGGYTAGPARLEIGDRLRATAGTSTNSVSGRLDFATRLGVLSGFAEHDGFRRTTNADVGARIQPLPFLALSGSVATSKPSGSSPSGLASTTTFRGEAGLRILGPWISAGMITTNKTRGLAPIVYDTLLLPTPAGRATARTVSIRGPLGRGFGIDSWLSRWDQVREYQPQYQGRSEINFTNSFLKRFPRGDFEVHAAGVFEYRDATVFPLAAGDVRTPAAKTLSALLEFRILRAVISYQQRNILGYPYSVIPGFDMPRVLAIYGVRWDFWN
ncbi:MAG: Plug domain-containing protein [Gemmatimonadota bacterium]|nr:Plug domain-containing protein [Gemmatimonadota bacterium]